MKTIKILLVYFYVIVVLLFYSKICLSDENIPISTKWLLDAAGETNRQCVKSVYMIINKSNSMKGTAFLLKNGPLVTNEHVVRGGNNSNIIIISPFNEIIKIKNILHDENRDLSMLIPENKLDGGLVLSSEDILVGNEVLTWGFPLGYNGPAPLLSVGHISGYSSYPRNDKKGFVKHIVVNGAFNPGNSGGPLFRANDDKVIGIVVSKHAPLTEYIDSAIKALANNPSGMIYSATNSNGEKVNYSEAQIVADILIYYRELSQVMIGEAISVSELQEFIKEQGIKLE
ncbi:MAG: serine protease [Elusimicrobia bacterium]|nr:serine protease [Elusimicrobiota bacterium]